MKNLFFLLMLASTSVFSQSVSLKGTAYDQQSNDKSPIPGATITIKGTYLGTITDSKGHYEIIGKNLPDQFTLVASAVGYESQELNVDLNDFTVTPSYDFGMTPKAYLQDVVIVNATRAADHNNTTVSKISEKELATRNLGLDLPFLLEQEPSLVTTSDAGSGVGYTGMRIRGSDATRINVTINGMPLNDAESQAVYWVDLPDFASSVENIQIQRGVGTSTNGPGAFGASVNIKTQSPLQNAFAQFSSSYGSFNTMKNTFNFGTGLLDKHFSIQGRASSITSNGYIDRASSDLKSMFLSAGYYDSKNLAQFVLLSGKEKTYQAWYGTPEDSLSTHRTLNLAGTDYFAHYPPYENQTDNYWQDHYQFFFSHQQNDKLTYSAALYLSHGHGYYEEYKADQDYASYGLQNPEIPNITYDSSGAAIDTQSVMISTTDLVRRLWLDNYLYGVNLSTQYESGEFSLNAGGGFNFYDGDHFGRIIWMQYAGTTPTDYEYYRGNGEKTDGDIFIKGAYFFNSKLNAFADLQFREVTHHISGSDENLLSRTIDGNWLFFNPKIGLNYSINEHHSFYTFFGIANKEPSRDDLVDAPQGIVAKSEKLNDFEFGYKLFAKKFGLQLNYYLMNYKDQLVPTGELNDVGNIVRTNVPKSYRAGVEAELGVRFTNWISLIGNLTLSQNKIKNYTEIIYTYDDNYYPIDSLTINNNYSSTDIAFSPSVIAAATLSMIPVKGSAINFISKYVGKQYLTNTTDEDRKLAPYFTENVRLNYTIQSKSTMEIQLTVTINNLFGAMYSSNGYTYSERYYSGGTLTDVYNYNYYYPQAGINWMAGITLKF